MIAVIASFIVKSGSEAEFEAVFADLAAQVRVKEPGNRSYVLTRAKKLPNTYRVMEIYADKDALKAHGASAHFAAAAPRLAACCEGDAVIELLDVIA